MKTGLNNGNVLLVGGGGSSGTWEIRNGSGALVSNGSLWASRVNHCEVKLSTGNVFLGGGMSASSTYEIRDQNGALVTNGTFFLGHDSGLTCNLVGGTNVFVAGGNINPSSWEIRNSGGSFVSNGTLAAQRACHTALTQSNTGNVLIVGGGPDFVKCTAVGSPSTWELRNSAGAFISSGSLNKDRSEGHTQTEY